MPMNDVRRDHVEVRRARLALAEIVRDVHEGRRDQVVLTRGELPVAVLVKAKADGAPDLVVAGIQRIQRDRQVPPESTDNPKMSVYAVESRTKMLWHVSQAHVGHMTLSDRPRGPVVEVYGPDGRLIAETYIGPGTSVYFDTEDGLEPREDPEGMTPDEESPE